MSSNNDKNLPNDLSQSLSTKTGNNLPTLSKSTNSSNAELDSSSSNNKTKEIPIIFKIAFKNRTEYRNYLIILFFYSIFIILICLYFSK